MDDLTRLPLQSLEDRINATNQTIEGLESHIRRKQDLAWMNRREVERLEAELRRRQEALATGAAGINVSKDT